MKEYYPNAPDWSPAPPETLSTPRIQLPRFSQLKHTYKITSGQWRLHHLKKVQAQTMKTTVLQTARPTLICATINYLFGIFL